MWIGINGKILYIQRIALKNMHTYAVTYIHKDFTGMQMIGTYLSAHMHACMKTPQYTYIHMHA